MIRAADFYRFIREILAPRANIDFLQGNVTRIVDGPERAEVHANELLLTADWVFDSRYDVADYRPLSSHYHYLMQHFVGWEIETTTPTFNPDVPRMFDFRTPQRGAMRFVYVLPYDSRRALVEYTLFSAHVLPEAEYETALQEYLTDVVGATDYRITDVEQGVIPMTDHPVHRQVGQRVMTNGTRGGQVKPSTGYAFHRIQQDSAAIVRSLATHDHPFAVPTLPSRYRFFDSILLQVLYRRGDLGARIFTALFQNNPIQRIFRFLDEESSWGDDLGILASVPPGPFIAAWARLKLLRRV
jgi:lycopene beta-cyclase